MKNERSDDAARGPLEDGTGLLERLFEEERTREIRIRKGALWSLGALCALAPLEGVAFYLMRMGNDYTREIGRAALPVIGVLGGVAALLGVVLTVAWLLRTRSVSLVRIERQLARMEELLKKPSPPV